MEAIISTIGLLLIYLLNYLFIYYLFIDSYKIAKSYIVLLKSEL